MLPEILLSIYHRLSLSIFLQVDLIFCLFGMVYQLEIGFDDALSQYLLIVHFGKLLMSM